MITSKTLLKSAFYISLFLMILFNAKLLINTIQFEGSKSLPLPYEKYNTYYSNIDTLDELYDLVIEEITSKNLSGLDIGIYVDELIRERFMHGTQYYKNTNNWLLFFADKFFPEKEFLGIMDPYTLIKSQHASCNQQAILFQEIVKNLGFEFGSVGINAYLKDGSAFGHFASALKYQGKWYFFDTNLEPSYNRKDSLIFEQLTNNNFETLTNLYPYFEFDDQKPFKAYIRDINNFPAKSGWLFQQITFFLSNFLWLILGILLFAIRKY